MGIYRVVGLRGFQNYVRLASAMYRGLRRLNEDCAGVVQGSPKSVWLASQEHPSMLSVCRTARASLVQARSYIAQYSDYLRLRTLNPKLHESGRDGGLLLFLFNKGISDLNFGAHTLLLRLLCRKVCFTRAVCTKACRTMIYVSIYYWIISFVEPRPQ